MVARALLEPNAEAKAYVAEAILPTLQPALCALARARPEEPLSWLADYLMKTRPPPPATPVSVDIVLVLGLEVSGGAALCASLATSMSAAGRPCFHVELQALIKAEISSGSDLGGELSMTIQQGKMLSSESLASLVRASLEDAPPGLYLLQGYPNSLRSLATMGEAVGYTPKRALLLELTEAEATARMAADGAGAPPAQRLKSFHMHARGMITELEQSQLLRRLDASLGADALLAAAQDALRGL